ncbi:MAG: bifunctional proline dehydrogenase/L-glutamate gamma-semialdehyde dehydrogenase PutA [Alphaproteobacteria bacterium]|nr:bifunctional proline dehydrogenase/L-glutamate gamma-semialdehyde dehydrogenase PutA [Alphaproteobacteria bacterium]MDP6811888.1 bifunctional proline dehydrogenase/L-glutamate gamma-semialdehyde dehydrogenase PutA [Alphaproteobacteria bacterium]
MLFAEPLPEPSPLRAALRAATRMDEATCLEHCLSLAGLSEAARRRVKRRATALVEGVRARQGQAGGLDAFLHQYELSSGEGVTLMCLAEALLRIPDGETADRLIRDKIGGADWERHLGHSDSWFVNASTWALMLTGRVLELDRPGGDWRGLLGQMVARSGEPVIRQAVIGAMRILGRQFVLGRTIEEALANAAAGEAAGYRHSYDMLGEAARTMADAERYVAAYAEAIGVVGRASEGRGPIEGPGVSVKLSALHPRFELAQRERLLGEALPRLLELAQLAKAADIGLTVDTEEADRLDLSLDLFAAVAGEPSLAGWEGLGLAVQAYQKRALPLLDWLADLARRRKRRLIVRLVKGAYWDSEIKSSQGEGLAGYPVFTRKAATDVSYIACARRLLRDQRAFHPAFASHNAHTLAVVLELAGKGRQLEFQRLHGMGEALYEQFLEDPNSPVFCRTYAPVGGHEELLAYLVRRLLENGANTSFVNRIVDETLPVDRVVADPIATVTALAGRPHPNIPPPPALYEPERRNSAGLDLHDPAVLAELAAAMAAADGAKSAAPLVAGRGGDGAARPLADPADTRRRIGEVVEADEALALAALASARRAAPAWAATAAAERADILRRAADIYEAERAALMTLAVREAGKTISDALAEVREAVDFLRYYAHQAEAEFAAPQRLPGPTGEANRLVLYGRGVFLCISPWNFPLAIFTGQLAGALAAGNAVLAKPAEQTPLIAYRAVRLLHRAGVPVEALHLLPGSGPAVAGPSLAADGVDGVAFTGSTATAKTIQRALAARDGPIVPLIAETGGQNAMVVDSSALPEQVTRDVLASAFQSAGQRCSACRVLFVQRDVADRLLAMIAGAMAELRVGDPSLLRSDLGPVIDHSAQTMLSGHIERMTEAGRLIQRTPLSDECEHGHFVAPHAFEIEDLGVIGGEKFGPILHVVRFAADRLDDVIAAINGTGYGLTLGIHSRIDRTVRYIADRVRVGNIYVNRNQIGAVVGVQPFGGEGLSGTGPKAGGPRYLHRFAVERTISTDTTAVGGNAALLALSDEADEVGDRSP